MLGVLLLFYYWPGQRVRLDADNCPVDGPNFIHVVLIDRSDPITPLQAVRVQQMIDDLVKTARPGERFDLYVAEGDGKNLMPSVKICSVSRGADANQLYENPAMIERKFQERFVAPLTSEVTRLMEPSTRPNSPILESIRTIAITSFGTAPKAAKSLTIVSDLIQNSPLNSHFKGETNFGDLQRRPQWSELHANLEKVDVRVLYLQRPAARRPNGQPIQNRGHQDFWKDVLEASRVKSFFLESL